MKLCFVFENGARETYFVDAPRSSTSSLGALALSGLYCIFPFHCGPSQVFRSAMSAACIPAQSFVLVQ
jgi:hypothetical protein